MDHSGLQPYVVPYLSEVKPSLSLVRHVFPKECVRPANPI